MDHLRKWILEMLQKEHAHASLSAALEGLSQKATGLVPEGLPYSIWQLTEHIRISQWDIVEFSAGPGHVSPEWPEGYWPASTAPADPAQWKQTLEDIRKDKEKMLRLVRERDPLEPFPYDPGKNLFREALLLLDHNAYHTGQIIVVRRLLGNWNGH